MEPTSEQELKQLLDEGRITEEEYQQLKEAMKQRLSEDDHHPKNMSAGEFALRKKMMLFSLITCIMGLPAGLILEIPFVWGAKHYWYRCQCNKFEKIRGHKMIDLDHKE